MADKSPNTVAANERFELRVFHADDAEGVFQLNADAEVLRHTGDEPFDDVEAAHTFIQNYDHYEKYGYGRWSIFLRDGEKYAGFCGLKYHPATDEVDLGFRLAQPFWGQGIASETSRLALSLGFHRYGLTKIIGRAMAENPASIAVLQKVGMSYSHEFDADGCTWRQYELERGDYQGSLALRLMTEADMPVLFEQQKDKVAVEMAAFTAKDPQDAGAFVAKTTSLIANPEIDTMTIEVGSQVVGNVMGFEMFGQRAVCYWLGREFWGHGYATAALDLFLAQNTKWPITARVAHDNLGSLRVLKKCGFEVVGDEVGFAEGRGAEIREIVVSKESAARR
ncbi:MAG: ribosomal-protein-alanine N-acetyltransferase [Candidatus Krumholzibacteriia bacterium]